MALRYLELIDRVTAPLPPMPVATLGSPAFQPIGKPLERCTVMLLNSAGVHFRHDPPFKPVNDLSFRRLAEVADPTLLRPSHPSPIRRPGRIDVNVVYPYERLRELADLGVIAAATAWHLSMLGAVKMLVALVEDVGPAIAHDARAAGADLLFLIPLCPACHQAFAVLARTIERCGVPTVAITGARDITERVRPPRSLFLDFPLGNAVGRPLDPDGQRRICRTVLEGAVSIQTPGEIRDLGEVWPEPHWEAAVVAQYEAEAEIVRRQRSSEFDEAGNLLAALEVERVASLI